MSSRACAPADDLCILVVTSEAYRPLAQLTGRLLDRHWAPHPPAFYCGASAGDERWLPRRDDPSDWMGIVLRATRSLRDRGYLQAYLLLEDHAPLFRCHARHLNRTLPALMTRLSAAVIGLKPWGAGTPHAGVDGRREQIWLERHPPDFPWKLQLHPSLWSLAALETVLETLVSRLPLDRRTPWAFEREAGRADAPLPDEVKRACYRVAGERLSAAPLRRDLIRVERLAGRVLRFLAGRVGGDRAWRRVDETLGRALRYQDGPYPHYLSGVLRQGRANEPCLRFLALHGRRRLVREIRDTIRSMSSARR